MRNRLPTVLLGPLAGGLGLATGHLLAALTTPSASPVLAVGSVVIDHTPTPVKEWAIAHFGTNDKTILTSSVLVVVLLVTCVVGPLARRRTAWGVGAFVALTAVAAACALSRPLAGPANALPSVVAAVVASVALVGMLRLMERSTTAGEGGSRFASRRTVLIGFAAVGVAAAGIGEAGRKVISFRARPENITLPVATDIGPVLPAGLDRMVPGITPFVTPNADFYRVDTRLDTPVVDSSSWSLTIDGMVDHPFTIGFDDLLAMPLIERDITLTCVSNSVGGPYVGSARWLGVRLSDLLERAGVQSGADQILSTDVGGMTISTPLALATDGRDAMVAIGMNGEPLPREHGFPARMVIPGLYGFISATKWVTRLTVTTYAGHDAYWTQRKWATDAPIKISSRIDTPRPLQRVKAGDVVVGGVAWAQEEGGVAKVEVSIDGGAWVPAQLGPSGGNDYWRQWFYKWNATPGTHLLSCRVTDGAGTVQSSVRALPFPDGASGLQSISIDVS
ncbi:molybdopterin-dependent oxidoreductase [Nocardioides ultimimeridianus]